MATTTVSSRSRRRFNMGCATLHIDEIRLAKDLHTACTLVYGEDRCRKMVATSPAGLFRRMRYGRRVLDGKGRRTLCLVSDNSQFIHAHKATDSDILTPFSRRWSEAVRRVQRLALMPRWADGWSATAETLDELGYAIAETITALLCCGIDSDEGVLMYERTDD